MSSIWTLTFDFGSGRVATSSSVHHTVKQTAAIARVHLESSKQGRHAVSLWQSSGEIRAQQRSGCSHPHLLLAVVGRGRRARGMWQTGAPP